MRFDCGQPHNTHPPSPKVRRHAPLRPNPGHPFRSLIATEASIHCADVRRTAGVHKERDPQIVEAVELGGIRTCLGVPMVKDNKLIGALLFSARGPLIYR